MQWWQAVILGLVEGVTEYLPVSSTGHLIITSSLLGLNAPGLKHATDAFNIVVQGGAILAVLGLYRQSVWSACMGLLGRSSEGLRLARNLIIAFAPAALLGPLLSDPIETHLFNTPAVLIALFTGGVWMIWLGRGRRNRPGVEATQEDRKQLTVADMSWRIALGIGLMQVVAMWPGTSRSMMTIAGGVMLGLHPREAAKFSFLLGLPTLGGACVFTLAKDYKGAIDTGGDTMLQSLGAAPILIGLLVATISAVIAVRWLVGFLNKHGLYAFGWYRIALCAVLLALAAMDIISVSR